MASLNVPSLSALSNPLPSVVNAVKQQVEQKQSEPLLEDNHKIVILYSKEVSSQDLEMIRRHGKVLFFNASLINVDLKSIDADYILCPADDEPCLRSLEKHFNDDKDNIDFCAYCRFYEKTHFDNMNSFASFKDAKNKEDFDFTLLNKKNFKKPNAVVSCASFFINFLAGLKK